MLWLVGLAAVVLTAGTTRLARPAWIVLGASILTTTTLGSAEHTLLRNLALLVAAIDASIAMVWRCCAARRPRRAASARAAGTPGAFRGRVPPTPVSSQPR